jgi:hypothetical protein
MKTLLIILRQIFGAKQVLKVLGHGFQKIYRVAGNGKVKNTWVFLLRQDRISITDNQDVNVTTQLYFPTMSNWSDTDITWKATDMSCPGWSTANEKKFQVISLRFLPFNGPDVHLQQK